MLRLRKFVVFRRQVGIVSWRYYPIAVLITLRGGGGKMREGKKGGLYSILRVNDQVKLFLLVILGKRQQARDEEDHKLGQ